MRKSFCFILTIIFIFSAFTMVYAIPTVTVNKNTPTTISLSGVEGDNVYQITTQPTHGTITDFNETEGTLTYTPSQDYIGADSFSYTAGTVSEVVNIDVVEAAEESPSPSPSESPSVSPSPSPSESPTATPTTEPLLEYADLGDHWAAYSAGRLGYMGIIIGEKINDKYLFYPDKIMTRAEFAMFLVNVLEVNPEGLSWSVSPGLFADEDQIPVWVRDEARAAKLAGIINGSENNGNVYFYANDTITRAEAVTMLNRAAMPTSYNTDPLTFKDTDQIPNWAVTPIKNMIGWGLVNGFEDNTFRPYSTITRAEAIELMWQLRKFNNIPDASARVAQTQGLANMQNMTLK